MIVAHYAALEARIEAGTGLSDKVFDTVRLDADGGLAYENYVILYSPTQQEIVQSRFAMIADYAGDVPFDCDIRIVGTAASTVRLMLDRVLTQVTGHQLVVSGRQDAKLRVTEVTNVVPDVSVKPFLYTASVSLEWHSRKA